MFLFGRVRHVAKQLLGTRNTWFGKSKLVETAAASGYMKGLLAKLKSRVLKESETAHEDASSPLLPTATTPQTGNGSAPLGDDLEVAQSEFRAMTCALTDDLMDTTPKLMNPAAAPFREPPAMAWASSGATGRAATDLHEKQAQRAKMKTQRDPRAGGWTSAYQFPGQQSSRMKNIMDKRSILAVPDFVCSHKDGCIDGTCCSQLDAIDVALFRSDLITTNYHGFPGKITAYLASVLRSALDVGTQQFSRIKVDILAASTTVYLCAWSFCFLVGASYATLTRAALEAYGISSKPALSIPSSTKRERERLSISLLRQYIQEVVMQVGQQQPVPGSQRSSEVVVTKMPWSQKKQAAIKYFEGNIDFCMPVMKIFKALWRQQETLREKSAGTHSKCDRCSSISDEKTKYLGNTSAAARERVKTLGDLQAAHDKKMEVQRKELDFAGLTAIRFPESMWCILADAATQRNFGVQPAENDREQYVRRSVPC